MVLLSPGEAIFFTVLLICVPLQMWLQHNFSLPSSSARDSEVFAIIRELHKGLQKYLSPHYWSTLAMYATTRVNFADQEIAEYAKLSWEQLKADPLYEGECPAVEVLRLDHPLGYFAGSTQQRRYRTSLVKYRVGQVVEHVQYGIRGVIIGWDESCKAPTDFVEHSYDPAETVEVCAQAHYAVLIDAQFFPQYVTHYIAQRYLRVIRSTEIVHPHVDVFFDQFDGSRYIPSKWLAAVYPED